MGSGQGITRGVGLARAIAGWVGRFFRTSPHQQMGGIDSLPTLRGDGRRGRRRQR